MIGVKTVATGKRLTKKSCFGERVRGKRCGVAFTITWKTIHQVSCSPRRRYDGRKNKLDDKNPVDKSVEARKQYLKSKGE